MCASKPEAVPVLVLDTETRHLPAERARAMVREAAESALSSRPWLIYKKTDSTLRGNIGAEFRGLLEAIPGRPLVYAPAYPELGRTVKAGRLLVKGVPVHLTAFGADPLDPVRESDIGVLLGGIEVSVLDGECSADVLVAAQTVIGAEPPTIAAGPAALAGALAQCLAPAQPPEVHPWPRLSRCLVVNGSLHPASAAQVAFARARNCFDGGWRLFDFDRGGEGPDRARRTGELVRRALEVRPADALIVFGGDTAFGIHCALGGQPFESCGEVSAGVPLSRCGDLFWITKAGGFGPENILWELRKKLV
jgi:uncharacterized protein YgbK (DUF1537 family)